MQAVRIDLSPAEVASWAKLLAGFERDTPEFAGLVRIEGQSIDFADGGVMAFARWLERDAIYGPKGAGRFLRMINDRLREQRVERERVELLKACREAAIAASYGGYL